MQKRILKFVSLIVITLVPLYPGVAQVSTYRLKQADSLFQAKRYVQSFEAYQGILQNKEYTPAMLLKMGFIQEGLDHPGRALYYLNLYYLATKDKATLRKMEELATKYNLQGYQSTDTDRFLAFYHDYYPQITIGLAVIIVFILSLVYYTKVKLRLRPIASLIGLSIFMIALFVHINFGENLTRAIVSEPGTYIMSGPSSAADVVEILGEGHRVEIIGKKDVWMKIRWQGKVAFIKDNDLLPVKL